MYDGVLEEHVRQKRAAIERALACELAAGGVRSGSIKGDMPSNITRSNANGSGSAGAALKGNRDARVVFSSNVHVYSFEV